MWLYAVRTDKFTTTLTEALVCLSWGAGYQLTRNGAAGAAPTIPTGNLLTLLSALYSFNFATQRIFTLLSKVTRHSFDIEETANLMNLDEGRDVSHEAATGNGTQRGERGCNHGRGARRGGVADRGREEGQAGTAGGKGAEGGSVKGGRNGEGASAAQGDAGAE